MAVEATDFNVFGIRVREANLLKVRLTMARTYEQLMKRSNKWEDSEFCKREIVSLWDGILEMLLRMANSPYREVGPDQIRTFLILDEDNWQFLNLFGEELKAQEVLYDILKQLQETEIQEGSLRIFFRDAPTEKRTEARIETNKMLQQVRRESEKIRNGLKYFVDWVRKNRRTLITCSLAAGIITVSLVALSSIGVSIASAKLLMMVSLAVVCLIYEAYGTYGEIGKLKRVLHRRLGLSAVNPP